MHTTIETACKITIHREVNIESMFKNATEVILGKKIY